MAIKNEKLLRNTGSTLFAILGFVAITAIGILLSEVSNSNVIKIVLIAFFAVGGGFIGKSIFIEFKKRGFVSFISILSATPELDNLELEGGQTATNDYSLEQIQSINDNEFLTRKIHKIRINKEPHDFSMEIKMVNIAGSTIELSSEDQQQLVIKKPSRIRIQKK